MNVNYLDAFYKLYSGKQKILILATIFLVLLGCAEQPYLKDADAPGAGQVVVFGGVDLIEDGKPMKWVQAFRLLILPLDNKKASIYTLSKDGAFNWALTPGEYMIAAYDVTKGLTGDTFSGRIRARFTVPQGVKGLYIGELKLLMTKGRYSIEIKDDYNVAIERYRKKFHGASDQPHMGMMKHEARLGTFERRNYICAKEWGLECKKKYKGVTPVHPNGVQSGFSKVNSLNPRFDWMPSSNVDVTYDLVIYEAVHFGGSLIEPRYTAGQLVVYKEGLKSPGWQSDISLKPNQKYIWSVRLRRDSVVSNWSTYSHIGFYLVAWTSGYGNWFKFSTPAK